MTQKFNKKKIILFNMINIPILICLLGSLYYQMIKLSGIFLIIIGFVFYIFRKEHSKYFYFKTYDLSMRFHAEDINEKQKYPNTSYEELKEMGLSNVLFQHKMVSIILIVGGILLVIFAEK